MHWVLVVYVLLPLTLAGIAFALTRWRAREKAGPEFPPREQLSILPQEWELVRRRQCGPSRCPRALGHPPRPRCNAECESCAAQFLERYWTRLLSGPRTPTD